MDLISVIVPVYGAEKFLDRCIKSIINQTYKNLEIILVDDGSKDNSPIICDKWSKIDNRIRTIHQTNQGVSKARNTGLENIKGEYFIQIDSDDYIDENMIERMYNQMIIDGTDLVVCDFEKGSEEEYVFDESINGLCEIINSEEALHRIYNDSHSILRYVVPWGKLYKKELFDGIQYPVGKIFEDIYVTHHVLGRCSKISVIDNKLVYYYQNSESIMNKKFHIGKLDYLDALLDRIQFFENKDMNDLQNIAYDEYLHSLIWEYSRARDILHNKDIQKDIKNRFRCVYKKGHISLRYPDETRSFLYLFNLNPEIIIWYWRIKAKVCRG